MTPGGYVEPETIRQLLRPDTLLVSVMHANNETGILQPVREIGELLRGTETLFHTDAAQTFGKEVPALKALHGRPGLDQRAQDLRTAGDRRAAGAPSRSAETGRAAAACSAAARSGACVLARSRSRWPSAWGKPRAWPAWNGRLAEPPRWRSASNCCATWQQSSIRSTATRPAALPHVLNVSFPGVDSEAFMMATRDTIAVSNGSACTSASYKPSHVL